MGISNVAMRDAFLNGLYDIAIRDRRVMLLTDDLGATSLDKFRRDLSSQYINVGIAEQNMVNVAAGLALGGKIVFMYGIAPFVTLRCYEQIKVDLCYMNLPVTCLGVGAGYAYDTAGPTHQAIEDVAAIAAFPGITIVNLSDNVMATAFAEIAYKSPGPKYIRFDREKFPLIYDGRSINFSEGLASLKTGRDLTIIATGMMVHQAFTVAEELAKHSIDAGIIDLYRIKPVNEGLLLKLIEQSKQIVTMEENLLTGGIGSIIAGILADNDKSLRLKRIGIPDKYYFEYGGRKHLHKLLGLDNDTIVKKIMEWLNP